MAREENIKKLEELGVKDSKKLSDKNRDTMDKSLEDIGEVFLNEITADDIDELREVMSLNEIELKAFAEVIKRTDADKIILDLPEPNGERFIRKLKDLLPEKFQDREFIAEHEADDKYPIVSAASIAAKSARERHVKELHKKYGYDFKSGYPHDKPTIEFLEKFVEEKGELPPETRLSWSTSQRILKEAGQSDLDDF